MISALSQYCLSTPKTTFLLQNIINKCHSLLCSRNKCQNIGKLLKDRPKTAKNGPKPPKTAQNRTKTAIKPRYCQFGDIYDFYFSIINQNCRFDGHKNTVSL